MYQHSTSSADNLSSYMSPEQMASYNRQMTSSSLYGHHPMFKQEFANSTYNMVAAAGHSGYHHQGGLLAVKQEPREIGCEEEGPSCVSFPRSDFSIRSSPPEDDNSGEKGLLVGNNMVAVTENTLLVALNWL
ncbi:uncharacterized protein LOC106169520 [Lingula anatina]|uniref:Uncharacterized protein LOC106169520 n=1 Tax=Lingula anatina TaxID=7574 RepID=A0A1S3J2G8_LINAN|nr:uncharacterized protein LOC106169520 [Lingula anatina]|eukprot:XP_013404443.1 uncharacterized protein LOC106169520 [Lingula anatina]